METSGLLKNAILFLIFSHSPVVKYQTRKLPPRNFETKYERKRDKKKSPQGLITETSATGYRGKCCHGCDDLVRISEKATKSPEAQRATPVQITGQQLFKVNMWFIYLTTVLTSYLIHTQTTAPLYRSSYALQGVKPNISGTLQVVKFLPLFSEP